VRIEIRIPPHPLTVESTWRGLSRIGQPSTTTRDGAVWLAMNVADTPASLDEALEVLVRLNELLMRAWQRQGRVVPSVYDLAVLQGFRYKPEPPGREWWQTFVDNMATNEGDCEDIACHQAAYYRVNGLPADAATKKTGRRIYHAITRHVGGQIEDPSLPLGLAEWRTRRWRNRRCQPRRAAST